MAAWIAGGLGALAGAVFGFLLGWCSRGLVLRQAPLRLLVLHPNEVPQDMDEFTSRAFWAAHELHPACRDALLELGRREVERQTPR